MKNKYVKMDNYFLYNIYKYVLLQNKCIINFFFSFYIKINKIKFFK